MQVYYYTRTGRSEAIAQSIAQSKGTVAHKIEDAQNWSGAIGFLKGGYAASKKQATAVRYAPPVAGEPLVLVFPVWAGDVPPAVRTFLEEVGSTHVTAVPTSLGTQLKQPERFAAVYALVGKEIAPPPALMG